MTFIVQTLPVQAGVPSQTLSVVLRGKRYDLRLEWIARIGRWLLDMDLDGDPIMRGRMICTSAPVMLERAHDSRRPVGDLRVIDLLGQGAEPTLSSLGARHRLAFAFTE